MNVQKLLVTAAFALTCSLAQAENSTSLLDDMRTHPEKYGCSRTNGEGFSCPTTVQDHLTLPTTSHGAKWWASISSP